MRLRWTDEAFADLDRIFDFLVAGSPIAAEKAVGRGRTNIGELAEVVVHGYDALHPLDVRLPFSADTTHRVATMSALKASRSTRALLRNRTLVATDAGWRIGSGSEIVADAAGPVLRPLPRPRR